MRSLLTFLATGVFFSIVPLTASAQFQRFNDNYQSINYQYKHDFYGTIVVGNNCNGMLRIGGTLEKKARIVIGDNTGTAKRPFIIMIGGKTTDDMDGQIYIGHNCHVRVQVLDTFDDSALFRVGEHTHLHVWIRCDCKGRFETTRTATINASHKGHSSYRVNFHPRLGNRSYVPKLSVTRRR